MQVARLERWEGVEPGPVVVGWDLLGDCGCVVREGLRLDRPGPRDLVGEPVISLEPCEAHLHRAHEFLSNLASDMPAPERPLHDVLVERFQAMTSR